MSGLPCITTTFRIFPLLLLVVSAGVFTPTAPADACTTSLGCALGKEICYFPQDAKTPGIFDTKNGVCIPLTALQQNGATTCAIDIFQGKTNCGADQVCLGAAPAQKKCTQFQYCPAIVFKQKNVDLFYGECGIKDHTNSTCDSDTDCEKYNLLQPQAMGICEVLQPAVDARICLSASVTKQYQDTQAAATTKVLAQLGIGDPAAVAQAEVEKQFKPIKATLSVPIPGVNFTDPDAILPETGPGGRQYAIPYIAQYVGGVFRYALFVIVMVALLTIMFAGILWVLAGGNAATIKKAQTMIASAIGGVFLAYASYAILTIVDPELTKLKNITVGVVEPDPISLGVVASAEEGAALLAGEPGAIPQLVNGEYSAGLTVPPATSCPAVVAECKSSKNLKKFGSYDTCMIERQKTRDMAYEAQKKTGYPAAAMLAQLKVEGPTFGKKCKGGLFVPSESGDQNAVNKLGCSSQPNCNPGYTWECIAIDRVHEKYKLDKPVAARDLQGGQPINCGKGEKTGKYWRVSGYACFSGAAQGGNIFAPLVDFYQKYDCYKQGRTQYGANPYRFALQIQACGYATGQGYGAALIDKIKTYCFAGPATPPLQKAVASEPANLSDKTDDAETN